MLTVAEVLEMTVVRAADPEVVAGRAGLGRTVRWVHTTELADIGPLLRGGDLLLTTGIALPDHPGALAAFVRGLAASDAVGLLVELGRRWHELPDALVAECDAVSLPLVTLRREARFATLTQAVGERLVDEQLAALREAERVHDTFTDLGLAEAGPDEILAAAQRLAAAPVVLEDDRHQVLDYRAGPGDIGEFLDDWERRSQRVDAARTVWDHSNGWLVTRVGRHDRGWGRLVIGSPVEPGRRLVTVAERAAAALAMHELHDRTRQGRLRRLHHELLLGVATTPADPDLARRIGLAGLDPAGVLVGAVLRPEAGSVGPGAASRLDELVAAYLLAAERQRLPALVAVFGNEVRALVSVPRRRDPDACLDGLVAELGARVPVTAAAGTPVTGLAAADRTLREAGHVMEALGAAGRPSAAGRVHRLEDVHLRGLLALLADDGRLRDFARRELAPLGEDRQLLGTLGTLLEHWGSKSAAADALSISRPVLYDRLHRIERLLGATLADAEVRASLHVALLAEGLLPTAKTPASGA